MLTAIALDDEQPALEVIAIFCRQLAGIELRRTFSRTAEAQAYLAQNPVDLLLLDINMPAQSGIDFYESITQPAMVIFTTAYSEYAVESYRLNAVDYLLKPFTFERFTQAVRKATEYYRFLQRPDENRLATRAGDVSVSQPHLLFRVDYSLVKVFLAHIRFIEGLDNYLKIHLERQKPVIVRLTMKALLDQLPGQEFVRVHRSYIVSLSKIQSVRNKLIRLDTDEIPLGSRYESDFYNVFQR